jgi:tetratricopeptide (TPR) repeat protein
MNRERPPDHGPVTDAADAAPRLRVLFRAAVDLPIAQRERWLADNLPDAHEREQLRRLLASDAASTGFLDKPADAHLAQLALETEARIEAPDALIGRLFGTFRLVRLLGQGGMAIVFLAEREGDFPQRVAVKLLHRGLYAEAEQRLFQRERRVLASLSHPHIAQLIDGGVGDNGVPYLVMEYVDGVPITHHVVERNLDVRSRLALFLIVCRAVEAAHRALVVHRDIKPSNILVTPEGTVKLLDFGIAKLLDEAPTTTVVAFTPEYAITTATDVYALGVLLHELLLGVRPEGVPTRRPSSLPLDDTSRAAAPATAMRRALRGDLDNILMKALATEPERRYATASAFADDVERHLSGRPVDAHPPSRWYRVGKFVQRHRGGVAITAVLVVGVLAALTLALWQAHQTRVALRQAEEIERVLVSLFTVNVPGAPLDQVPGTRELLAQGAARTLADKSLDAATRARVLSVLASVHHQLALDDDAITLGLEAVRTLEERYGPNDPRLASPLLQIGSGYTNNGAFEEALRVLRRARLLAERSGDAKLIHDALGREGGALRVSGDLKAAEALQRERMARAVRAWGTTYPEFANDNYVLAATLGPGRESESAPLMRTAVRAAEDSTDSCLDCLAMYLNGLAITVNAMGQGEEAERLLTRVIAIDDRLYSGPHRRALNHRNTLGVVMLARGRTRDAEKVLAETLAQSIVVVGPDHHQTANTRAQWAVALRELGRLDEAEANFQLARGPIEAQLKPENLVYENLHHNLAETLILLGKSDEAVLELDALQRARRERLGPAHALTLQTDSVRSLALAGAGRLDDARAQIDASALAVAKLAATEPQRMRAQLMLGLAAARIADRDRAKALLSEALATFQQRQFAGDPRIVRASLALAELAIDMHDRVSATAHLDIAERAAKNGLPLEHAAFAQIAADRARLLTQP